MMAKKLCIFVLATGLALASGVLLAQSATQAPPQASVSSAQAADSNRAPQHDHGNASIQTGAENPPAEEEEENAQFKYSSIVKKDSPPAPLKSRRALKRPARPAPKPARVLARLKAAWPNLIPKSPNSALPPKPISA
jgi:hypothetical protein